MIITNYIVLTMRNNNYSLAWMWQEAPISEKCVYGFGCNDIQTHRLEMEEATSIQVRTSTQHCLNTFYLCFLFYTTGVEQNNIMINKSE